jgi:hypothetical protein
MQAVQMKLQCRFQVLKHRSFSGNVYLWRGFARNSIVHVQRRAGKLFMADEAPARVRAG